MRHVEGSAHSNSVSLTPTFKKGVRDLVGSATEQKLATCSVKEGFMRGRAEARESGNSYSQTLQFRQGEVFSDQIICLMVDV